MRRVALALSALTATGLLLTACGGSSSSSPEAGPSASKSDKPPTPEFWPLTGIQVPDGKTSALDHPVLVAKMDNTTSSQPQVGLSKADMVVEELVEGGLTRLAAFYYSEIPTDAGPIRSMRASDIDVVSPVHASMVTSGAAAKTIARISGAGIPFYGQSAQGMYRSSERPSPYNLLVHLNEVAKTAHLKKATTPPDYFQWGTDQDMPKGIKATSITAQFSGGHGTEWQFTNGSYHNLNSNAPGRRPVPGHQRAGAAGARGPRRLPRPGRQPGARDAADRQGQGPAVPRRPDGRRELAEGEAGQVADHADQQEGRRSSRCRRVTRGSSSCRSTAATSSSTAGR